MPTLSEHEPTLCDTIMLTPVCDGLCSGQMLVTDLERRPGCAPDHL